MKPHLPHRIIAAILSLCTLLSVCAFPTVAADKWKSANADEIYVETDAFEGVEDAIVKELDATLALCAAEYTEKLGKTFTVDYGKSYSSGSSSLVVRMQPNASIAAQAYSITVENGVAVITASDSNGVLYGLRHALKQILVNGTITDVALTTPAVAERAVSLDNGRKYFSLEWLKELVRTMSWHNMNTLTLHFSEEMGLGIESKLYPWLNGRDGTLCTQAEIDSDNTQLTQDEVRELVAYAKLYHVDIIPSLDSPGHMNYIVKKFNEHSATGVFAFEFDGKTYTVPQGTDIGNYFHYDGRTAIVQGSRNGNYSRGIDISNEIAVAFTKSLLGEYAKLFADLGCTKFDIGGDELLGWGSAVVSTEIASRWEQLDHWKAYAVTQTGNDQAVAYDAFILYMNDLNRFVRSMGYTSVRMWNDDALRSHDTGWTGIVELDDTIDVWYWSSNNAAPSTYLENGHGLYNILSDYTYYAMIPGYYAEIRTAYPLATPETIYNKWSPYVFSKDGSIRITDHVLGGAVGVWCDNPTLRTQDEVMDDIRPLIQAISTKSWDPDMTTSYDTWASNMLTIGEAPLVDVYTLTSATVPDNSRLLELIAEFDTYQEEQNRAIAETGEPKWIVVSFENYKFVVDEARTHMVGYVNLLNYTQAHIDDMAAIINASRNNLFTAAVGDPLRELIEENRTVYAPQHAETPYTLRTWLPYNEGILAAEEYLATNAYDPYGVQERCSEIIDARDKLELEASSGSETNEGGLVSAGFVTSSVRRGMTARMIVHTKRDMNVRISWLCIYDQNGATISPSCQIVEMPLDPANPDIRSYYVTFKVGTTVGDYTYRVHGVVDILDSDGKPVDFSFTDEYIDCPIYVR